MRRMLVLVMAAALFIGAVAVAGCGKSKVTMETDEGKVEVSEKGGKITTETDKGKTVTEVSDKVPTEEELGVPVYPNAKVDKDSSGSITTTTEEGTSTFVGASLVTDDSFSEVVAWYKEKLSGKPGFVDLSMGSTETALFSVGTEEEGRIVAIETNEDGKTQISIASSKK